MNTPLRDLMAHATELTRAGRLREAVAAIQAVLGRGARPVVTPEPPTGHGEAIDVEARDISTPQDPPRAAPASGGEFLALRHTGPQGSRNYKLFVPHVAGARPMVLMLHGCTQDPDDLARGTGMNTAAAAQGLLVVYPEQARDANTSGCWNWFKHNHQSRGKGEPALLAGMVDAVMASHAVDPRRVYVAGLSAGGAMAAILGDAYPDLFAAVGVHSGLPTGSARDLQSAFAAMQRGAAAPAMAGEGPPTIVFHGDSDTTVHPVNGAHVVAACAGATAVQPEHGRADGGRAYTRQIHADASGRVRAEHWVVHGSGHAWSGGSAQGSFTDPLGPDATAEMLRFFLANPQAAAG